MEQFQVGQEVQGVIENMFIPYGRIVNAFVDIGGQAPAYLGVMESGDGFPDGR
eukprot:CAMPEP_0198509436 /NCGR_PEP_ID=MMETSP1462-20131121/13567_1 /TAXON_ID=1333877 /ORGANISM="Brandtodinium nutriculum, Strain RCC3387" /LENGTH=52 /DNA_ID=CAMNT_0044238745 /DNA_START=24 /DNA_END=179 /DNA_ORIENTATION=+